MITRLKVKNFVGIEELDVRPGRVNRISGRNAAGKTSVLAAIQAAFRGRGIAHEVVRHGADKAEILVELSDGRTIARTITEKEKGVVVQQHKAPMPKPQAILDALVGSPGFGFNPVEFFEAKPDEQKRILLDAIDVRFKRGELERIMGPHADLIRHLKASTLHALVVLEQAMDIVYDERRKRNAEADHAEKAARKEWERVPEGFDEAPYRVEVRELYEQLAAAEQREKSVAQAVAAEAQARTERNRAQNDVGAAETEIQRLEEALAAERKRLETHRALLAEREAALAQAEKLRAEEQAAADLGAIDAIREKIEDHERGQVVVGAIDRARELEREAEEIGDKAKDLDALYRRLKKDVAADLLSRAELPIEKRLSVEDGKVLADDVPLAQLSSSEQFRLALGIARALAGELKLICLDGAERLDPDHLAELHRQIEADEEFQYFITEVTEGPLAIDGVRDAAAT